MIIYSKRSIQTINAVNSKDCWLDNIWQYCLQSYKRCTKTWTFNV